MPIFPTYHEGDELSAQAVNWIFAELERWRHARAIPPLTLINQGGQAPPIFGLGGQGDAVYFCSPTSAVLGSTGTWPNITPASFSADIYQAQRGTLVKLVAGGKVFNWYAASLVATKVVTVSDNRDGSFSVIAQSCT
jgi:hypothetical protein